MAVCQHDTTDSTELTTDFELPANAASLLHWLEAAPNFIEIETESATLRGGDQRGISNRRLTRTRTESVWLNPEYEVSTRACYNSQAEVCEAWEEMKFPAHRIESRQGVEGAFLYTWSSSPQPRTRAWGRRRAQNDTRGDDRVINYSAVQHPDGHGVIEHYDTIAAVRTKNGLVLVNEQDYGSGFAKITRPDEWDHELPLDGVESVLSDESETVYDIERVVEDQTRIRYRTTKDPIGGHKVVTGIEESWNNDRQVRRVELSTGAAVIILFDSTAQDSDETKCGFYLSPEEAELYEGAQGALDALQPIDVKQAKERGLDIVPADEYAGNGAHGFYDDDLLGEAMIRQGEWYLIPMDEDFAPDVPIYKPLPTTGRKLVVDHIDTAEFTDVDDVADHLPDRCACGSASFTVAAKTPQASCDECGTLTWYGDESDLTDLVDTELYDAAVESLGSHTPRDLAVTDDATYVRGTFRHVDNEHNMVNLKERWHLVAENTRDVTVFDLGADTNGVARWE